MPAQGKYTHVSGRGPGAHKSPDVPRDDPLPGGIADAVLAALPYRVGVLDHTGTIVAANDLWRRFIRDHGALTLGEGGIGMSYREAWQHALGRSSPLGEDAADPIQAVLEGTLPEFTLEYPADATPNPPWFLLRAIPLRQPPGGAAILHTDITERKLAEQERAHLLTGEQATRETAEAVCGRMEQLQAVTDAALGHLALADLVPALIDRIRQVMTVDDVSIFLLTEDGQALTLSSTRGVLAGIQARIPMGQGVVGRIALSRAPLIIDDLSRVTVVYPVLAERLHSLAGVPLLAEGRLVGVLHVGTVAPRHFTEADVQLLQLVGERIALALDKARLYEVAQTARQEAEARAGELAATFEAMTDAVVVCDRERHVLRANRAYRELMARVRAPLTDSTPALERTAHLDIRDAHEQPLPRAQWPIPRLLRGEVLQGTSTIDVRVRSPDGQGWEFNISGAPVGDTQGYITAAVAVLRDVTEHRRLERRIQEGLDAILAMARALTGPDRGGDDAGAPGTDLVARGLVGAARQVLGCERVSLMEVDPETEHLHPLVSVGWPAEIEQQWHSALRAFRVGDYLSPRLAARLRAGEALLYDFSEAAQRGLPTYSASKLLIAPLRLGASLVGVLILDHGARAHVYSADEQALVRGTADLAALVLQRDRLWREREEARANELALQETTRRMEQFLAIASHDLRTPLTSTVGFVDLASRQFRGLASIVRETNPELGRRIDAVKGCLDDASQGGKRLSRLVNLLFDTSLLQAGKLELHCTPFDLMRLVREQVEALRMSAPQRTIRLQIAATEPVTVVADADRIGQVIMNYVTNALKYSPNDQLVDVRMAVAGASARVAVADRGPGLPMSEQERIWQPFYRAPGVKVQSGSSVGLGLGLHICKAIIERHGGQVGLDSTVGRGSIFWFTLPVASASGVAVNTVLAQGAA